ncbi:cobalt ECF transporter T component CbiQ [Leptolyngbya sp. 'hensonii']|uniref:cobalt ECF transporter T component CbiQ n=1 Tax=Leptolyngbya sp. 'hensonii' TaxID=1922337 RepID=UPI00094FEA62|nr:cobalt ECF transporter T component CbiQ [Leptolyngbya sp. 'hensonii']OLP15887.1 cobalt ECF transporter T component CbiQ [Leptolyngbya sp. 'hensonii']
MHHHLDAYAYTNRLGQLPPIQKLSFVLVVLLMALMAHPPTQGAILLWMALWTIGYAGIPVRVYCHVFGMAAFFLGLSIPALVLEMVSVQDFATVQGNSLGGVVLAHWYVFVSHSGLIQAGEISLRSLASVACLLLILFTVPFSELLTVLRHCRVPTVLLDLLLLMYRFLFLFLDVATQLQLAQQARGGYRTRKRWMESVALLAGQLLVRSLQRYQQFSLGLAARGFNGDLQVYSTQSYTYSTRYALESVLGCVGLVILDRRFFP